MTSGVSSVVWKQEVILYAYTVLPGTLVDEVVVMIIGSNGDVVILITDDYSLISV